MKEQPREKAIAIATAIVIAVILGSYFAPFADNFFAYDDFRYIENMYKEFLDVLLGYGSFRIVSNLAWWPIHTLSGFNPVGYNIFSFAMLFAGAMALYFLVRELTDPVTAALTAALFAGGSVGADAALWKCTNSTLICFVFYTLSLLAYLRWRKDGGLAPYAMAIASFMVALLAKEEAASLPGVLILLELLLLGERKVVPLAKRVAPYCIAIVLYLVGSRAFFSLVGREPEPERFFKIRPLHTLLTPWSTFSLSPDGFFDFSSPYLYLIPAALVGAGFLVPRKKELCFAFGWVLLTFVPQSFTSLGQFTPKYLFNSVSRYLYLPSAGAALAIALVLVGIGSRWGRKVGVPVATVVLACYFSIHYRRVHERGNTWKQDAEPVRVFLHEMKRIVPQFPPSTHLFVLNAPTGRAYVQQALRAAYRNPDITWIVDPLSYHPQQGQKAFLVGCLWQEAGMRIDIMDFEAGMQYLAVQNR